MVIVGRFADEWGSALYGRQAVSASANAILRQNPTAQDGQIVVVRRARRRRLQAAYDETHFFDNIHIRPRAASLRADFFQRQIQHYALRQRVASEPRRLQNQTNQEHNAKIADRARYGADFIPVVERSVRVLNVVVHAFAYGAVAPFDDDIRNGRVSIICAPQIYVAPQNRHAALIVD